VLWGVGISHNAHLFKDELVQNFQTFSQVTSLFQFYKENTNEVVPRAIGGLHIDKTKYWNFFDGACKGQSKLCGI